MVTINVTLTFQSPLNIGSGAQQGTLAQRGMLKDKRGWPYVPASAFKGRLRHAVEQVTQTLNITPPVCRTNQEMCRHQPCVVCQLFGSPWQAGIIRLTDCELSGPPEIMALKDERSHPRSTERTGVTLNRARRVAEDRLLYSTELLFPGMNLAFDGRVSGDFTPAQTGLILAGLHLIPAWGRGKTGGLGWVVNTASVTPPANTSVADWQPEALLSALQSGGAL